MYDVQFESLYPEDTWQESVGRILEIIHKGQSCQVLGLPGVGRYMVLGILAFNKKVRLKHLGEKQKLYQFVYVDFSEIRNRPLSDVMKMMFLALADSLRDRKMHEEYEMVNTLLRNAISMQDELVLTEELKHTIEQLASEKDIKVIYLFDRFEDYIPKIESTFFANLRLLRNRAKYHFSCVFALNKPLEELLEPQILEDFYDLMVDNTVYLPLADIPSVDFRISHLEKLTGKKIPKEIVSELLTLTGGHGKLMRMASESYLAQGDKPKDIESFLLSQKIVINALLEIWLSFSPMEQQYLVIRRDQKEEVDITYFENVGLIKNNDLTIPLLKAYLSKTQTPQKLTHQKILYDQATNRIMKGNLILSDDLTSSEFLLLRYLVLHPEKIVDRDELISVVWGDNRSTAGVTDQALDQLLFRLRKKVEEDPAKPTHILTVKGRGFKFVP